MVQRVFAAISMEAVFCVILKAVSAPTNAVFRLMTRMALRDLGAGVTVVSRSDNAMWKDVGDCRRDEFLSLTNSGWQGSGVVRMAIAVTYRSALKWASIWPWKGIALESLVADVPFTEVLASDN